MSRKLDEVPRPDAQPPATQKVEDPHEMPFKPELPVPGGVSTSDVDQVPPENVEIVGPPLASYPVAMPAAAQNDADGQETEVRTSDGNNGSGLAIGETVQSPA
jgi:hypothetical protein